MTDHELLTDDVRQAMARAASEAIMPLYRRLKDGDVRQKQAGEAVTVADELSEAILVEELGRIDPSALIVGEEAVAADPGILDRLSASRCWIIDPLDGTGNFVSGRSPFGIMVALAKSGEAVGGWILDPLSGRFCHATRGGGAWIDGVRIAMRRPIKRRPVLAVSTLFATEDVRNRLFGRLLDRFEIIRMPRCAAHQYPSIALGLSDIALYGRTLPWDHAAGVIFLTESGGQAARLDGSPYLVHDRQPNMIAAASPQLWDDFAVLLGEFDAVSER